MQDWEEWEKHEFFQFSGGSQNKYFSSEVKWRSEWAPGDIYNISKSVMELE